MNTRSLWRWCTAAGLILWPGLGGAQAPDLERMDIVLKAIPNGPVAVVGNERISSEEFRDLYIGELVRLQRMERREEISDLERIDIAMNCLRLLTERAILFQEAGRRKVTVSDAEVAKAWDQEVTRLGRSLSENTAEPLSEETVLKLAGVDREEALKQLHRTLVIEKIREQILKQKGVTVTDKEIEEFYKATETPGVQPDRVRIHQIFIKDPARSSGSSRGTREEARRRAETALARVRSGQSFTSVAKAESETPFSGNEEVAPVVLNRLPEPVQEAIRHMSPGELSGVIESPFGFHIVKLLEVLPGKEVPFEEVKPRIQRLLLTRKGNEAVRQFCAEVTEGKEPIHVFLDLDKQLRGRPDLRDKLEALWVEEKSESGSGDTGRSPQNGSDS